MDKLKDSFSHLSSRYMGFLQYTNPKILLLFFFFAAVSIWAVVTASGSETYEYIFEHKGLSPIVKHLMIWIICIATVIVMPLIPLRLSQSVRSQGSFYYLSFCLVLLILLFTSGVSINGSTRWVYLFGVSIQPSEFLKLGFILTLSLMSCLFQEQAQQDRSTYWRYYGIPLIILMVIVAIIGYSNMSTAIIYIICSSLLLFIYKMPFRWLFSTLGVVGSLAGLVLLIGMMLPEDMSVGRFSTVKSRIERSLEPKSDTLVLTDENRQEYYANIAIANSQFWGRKPGASEIKDILPMAMSDYILAVIIEEIGVFGIAIVAGLYIAWFYLILGVARKEEEPFFRYVLYGIGVFYPFQALINFVVVSGIITTGQPLPFISAGGSSILSNSISLGIVLMISRWQTERKLQREAAELQASSLSNS